MAVKEGEGELFDANEKYPGTQRFFANYEDQEIRALFEPYFEILKFVKKDVQGRFFFLNYLMLVKSLAK